MSSPQSLAATLAQTDFFSGMDDDELLTIAVHAHAAHFDAGTEILHQGQPAEEFFLIIEGRIEVEVETPEEPLVVQDLGPGDILGISWMLPPYYWRFSARAMEDVNAIVFDGKELRIDAGLDRKLHDDLLTRMVNVMAQRLQAARMQMVELHKQIPG
jgi:CRP-like cAMP-binding protein